MKHTIDLKELGDAGLKCFITKYSTEINAARTKLIDSEDKLFEILMELQSRGYKIPYENERAS